MNAIEYVAIVGGIVLIAMWLYYHARLRKAQKEEMRLQNQLKQKEAQDAKDNSKSSKS